MCNSSHVAEQINEGRIDAIIQPPDPDDMANALNASYFLFSGDYSEYSFEDTPQRKNGPASKKYRTPKETHNTPHCPKLDLK